MKNTCIQEIRNLISRSSGPKLWLDICVKTEDYLQEASVKQKLSILDVVWKWISVFNKKEDLTSENAEEFLLPLTSIWCTIYLCSLRNLKLCQKVKKIFSILCEIKPQYAKCEIKRNIKELLSSPTSKIVNAIEIVCQLIDVFELGKECVDELFENFVTTVSHCLNSYCLQYVLQQSEAEGLLCNSDVCQAIVKAVLKTFQYFPRKIGFLLYGNSGASNEGSTVLETVINNLLRILFCKTLPKECTFLCGTATGLLLGIAADLKPCICSKEIITQLLITSGASFIKHQAVQHHNSVMIGCLKFKLPPSEYKPITQLAIVMGIIKSEKNDILLEVNDEQTTLMEGLLFHATYTLCKESKNSPVHYVAFEAMRQWLLCMKNLFKKKLFHEDTIWMTRILYVSHTS
ncbi:hypothetical protein OS493_018143 [Desmophyllum pertusum]|uniref:Uncharacterized protein n=1 Tax=Desmophyllum pertusum TaxID=174260 RepID=A0A9W9YRJ8_9CNID|nr:hypothetical protein OS493_018143 [Desmophyllum pertusum]